MSGISLFTLGWIGGTGGGGTVIYVDAIEVDITTPEYAVVVEDVIITAVIDDTPITVIVEDE